MDTEDIRIFFSLTETDTNPSKHFDPKNNAGKGAVDDSYSKNVVDMDVKSIRKL